MNLSITEHTISLAREIIDDIELSKLDCKAVLLKATRLARHVDDENIRKWLRYEMQGYNSKEEISLNYMSRTGRWIDKDKLEGYWYPLAQVEASSEAQKQKLALIRIPDTSGDRAIFVIDRVTLQMNNATSNISKLEGIKSRVVSLIHDFATNVFYQNTFDSLAENIFDNYKKDIDLLIAENLGDIIEQIPSVISRLAENNSESVSQALTTCRRIIDSFADHIYPATDSTIIIGGNEHSLKQDKVLNRINAYIYNNSESESRRKKIRQNVSNLYERVSAGVHSDVDSIEAKSLFFNTYLILGEILTLKKQLSTKSR